MIFSRPQLEPLFDALHIGARVRNCERSSGVLEADVGLLRRHILPTDFEDCDMAVCVFDRCTRSPALGAFSSGTFLGHRSCKRRAIGACLGQLIGDVLARVVDVVGGRCLALRDFGASPGRACDANECPRKKENGESDREEQASSLYCRQSVVSRGDGDHRGDVRGRPQIPEQDDDGANREQDAENNGARSQRPVGVTRMGSVLV
jgi:hypothetical protein